MRGKALAGARKFWLIVLVVLLTLWCGAPSRGQAKPVILDETLQSKSFGKEVFFLEDRSRKLTITDVTQPDIPWEASDIQALNLGLTSSAYWFRFTVNNVLDQEKQWYLEILFPHIDSIDLYIPQDGGFFRKIKSGTRYPFSSRDIPDRSFVFSMSQPPGQATYYVRLAGDYPLIFDPVMRSHQAYLKKLNTVYPIFWLYYGALFIMIVYNLILYGLVRSLNILYLVLFITVFMLLEAAVDGFAFQYLWPNATRWSGVAPLILLSLMMTTIVIFIRDFINLPELLESIYDKIWIYTVIAPNLVWAMLCLLLGKSQLVIYITAALTGYSTMAVVAVGTACIVKGKITRAVRFTWISFSPLCLAAIIAIMTGACMIPVCFFTPWLIHTGGTIFIALLSVGLADKMTALKDELIATNANISLMLESISQQSGADIRSIDECREDEIGGILQSRFHGFMDKFKDLVTDVRGNATALNDSSKGLFGLSEKMTAETGEMATHANSVATASEQMSAKMTAIASTMEQTDQNVNLIASSTEEMTTTVHEITTNTEMARKTTAEAVSQSERVSERVDALGRAAEQIGSVTETITEISQKTNLLALNATIEAARAGESGRGFAVVAGEIKELARQTADATQEINQQIEENRAITTEAVGEIRQIMEIISRVNEIVSTIASSIEEQSTSTREIANNVSQISQGVTETNRSVAESSEVANTVSRDVSALSGASRHMNDNSLQIKESAAELSRIAEHLTTLIEKFRV